MADARHTPEQDTSFRRSLVRNLAGAVGLVVLVAAVFGVLGMFGREDLDDLAIGDVPDDGGGEDSGADDPDATDAGADESDPDVDAQGEDQPGSADVDSDDPVTGSDEPAGASEEPGEPDADGSDADEADEEPAAEPEPDAGDPPDDPPPDPAEEEPASGRIDPATISVQVLDGYRSDGGTAAAAVTAELRDAGYRIIATNPALAYDVTTVLWSPGFESEGRQIAAEIGAADAREQPGNLSNDVNVHVVVGADRG